MFLPSSAIFSLTRFHQRFRVPFAPHVKHPRTFKEWSHCFPSYPHLVDVLPASFSFLPSSLHNLSPNPTGQGVD